MTFPGTMTGPPPRTRASRLASPFSILRTGTIGVGVLLLAVTFVPAASASSGWTADSVPSWSNGVVLCQFPATRPVANISALDLPGTGLTVQLAGMSETRPNGTIVAVASLASMVWTVSNASSEDAYDMAFSAVVPLVAPSAGTPTVGSVDLRADFVLPLGSYSGASAGGTSAVTFQLTVSNWTWQAAGDSLAMTFLAAPTYPSEESLRTASSDSGWMFSSASTRSGQNLEWMGTSPTATAWTGSGTATTVAANSSVTVSPASATVIVGLGSEVSAYQSMMFETHVGIVLPSSVAGIPTADLVAVGVAAALASLGIAALARRIRSRPSRLIYVDDEEP